MTRQVGSHCPETNPLYAAAYWYTTPDAPAFEVCSYCYATQIRPTPWVVKFQGKKKSADPNRHCRFSTLRIRNLWPQCLHNNDWSTISRYMTHRATLADCKGLAPSSADVGIKWYSLKHRDIPNFDICAACYEDIALATPFRNMFEPHPTGQPAGEEWVCTMTNYAGRAMELYAKSNRWRDFVINVTQAGSVRPCEGLQGVVGNQRRWFRPKRRIEGLVVCDACFYDWFGATCMEHEFEPTPVSFANGGYNTWVCDMALIPMKIAQMKALQAKDFGVWWNAAREILVTPQCTYDGNYTGGWYGLKSNPECANICAQCFAGTIKVYGFRDRFIPIPNNPNRRCVFSSAAPRQLQFFNRLDEAIMTRSLTTFEDYARRIGNLPLCPKSNPVENQRWYGSNEFLICVSCWEEFAKDTALAPRLPFRGVVRPSACCDLYSPRMRGLWTEACAKGDMSAFVAFAKHRAQIYAQTVPAMQQMLAMAKMRMEQQQTLMLSSVMLQGADNVVGASRPVGMGYDLYGNGNVGFHYATPAGATGAAQFQQALGITSVQGGEMMQVAQLEALWQSVE